jgi:hypothetical protein
VTAPALFAAHTGAHRARRRSWYELPTLLAVLFVMVVPWVAVRDMRSRTKAFVTLCDVMLVAYQRGRLGPPKDRPRPGQEQLSEAARAGAGNTRPGLDPSNLIPAGGKTVTESSPASPDDDSWKNENGWESFDVKKFARDTMQSIEMGDEDDNVTELRLERLEEITAAYWPRSMILRWRLRREIRASVATWDDDYIPRGNFGARRGEWAMQQGILLYHSHHRSVAKLRAEEEADRLADEAAERLADEGGTDPGAGFLP